MRTLKSSLAPLSLIPVPTLSEWGLLLLSLLLVGAALRGRACDDPSRHY